MRCARVRRELSALLDGESRRAGEVQRHLEACPACAAEYSRLTALSVSLRSLEPPAVSPWFATRVVAATREVTPGAARRHVWAWAPAAALALLLATWGSLYLFHAGAPGAAAPAQVASSGGTAPFPAGLSADLVRDEVVRRLAAGEDPGPMDDAFLAPDIDDPFYSALSPSEALDALVADGALSGVLDSLDETASVQDLLDSLTPAEAEALQELLTGDVSQG